MTVQHDIRQMRDRLSRPALPQQFAPAGAYVQDFFDFTTVPFGSAFVTARSYVVNPQKKAVAKYLAMDTNNEVADVFIRFRFLVNGSPFVNYQAPPVVFSSIQAPTEIWIELDQQNTLDLQLQNLDDTQSYFVTTRLVLWTWDTALPRGGAA